MRSLRSMARAWGVTPAPPWHTAANIFPALPSRISPWKQETGLGVVFPPGKSATPPNQGLVVKHLGAHRGPPGRWRAHPQQRDARPLFPRGIYVHPQTSRTYFRTTEESPELIGPIVPPPAGGLRPPLSAAPPSCSEAPPRLELGGASRSEPWTVACLL